ncbi:MAG: TlpA disulfide reductase family protein [Planctomycetota bacterium]
MAEMPELVQLQEEGRAAGLRVVAVSFDLAVSLRIETAAEIGAFAREKGLDALDVVAFQGELAALPAGWQVPGPLPYTFVLDREGQVADRQEGPTDAARFAAMVAAARR